jgi:DNA (cytosine-5)-methyltransferase 1
MASPTATRPTVNQGTPTTRAAHAMVPAFDEPEWVDIRSMPTSPSYTVVDLCCGGGLAARGFRQAGFEAIAGVEMDPDAAATFRRNLPEARLIQQPIERVGDDQLLEAVGERGVDVVFAGLPCQGFSTASGLASGDDLRNWLFVQLVRVVDLLRPHAVVIENVPTMPAACGGAFARWIDAALGGVGYPHAAAAILLATHYGVPQSRQRLFVVANRHGMPNPLPLPIVDEWAYVTIGDAIGDLADCGDDEDFNHVRRRHSPEVAARIGRLMPGQSLSDRYTQASRRDASDAPSHTVVWAHGSGMVHPWLPRAMTVREVARLQGVPDDHRFRGGTTAQGTQVANGVPTPVARAVALALRPLLDATNPEGGDTDGAPDCTV